MDFFSAVLAIVCGILIVIAGVAVVILVGFGIVAFVLWALTATIASVFKS